MNRIFKSPFNILILLLFFTGTLLHFAPFLSYQRLVYSISEDGYYMLTMARNIAAGYGMSIAGGTIPTNGTQPLMTLIMSGLFYLTGGDKILTIKVIIILQWMIAVLSSYLIWKTGTRLLKKFREADKISILAAAVWYASPLMLKHTMNGLETGFYALAVLFVISFIIFNDNPFEIHSSVVTGFLLGITFLVRNDAVFLIAAVCILFLMPGLYPKDIKFSRRFVSVFIIGVISLLTAGPWLLYNQMIFGWIMPISGQAEMLGERIGGNFINLPRILSEYFVFFIPLSLGAQKYLPVLLAWIIFTIAVMIFIIAVYKKADVFQKRLIFTGGIFLILICLFYSTVFDNYYFLPRYIFPVSTLIAIGWSALIFYGLDKIKPKFKNISRLSPVIFVILMLVFSYDSYNEGNKHMHFQVVNWVNSNVNNNEWVSAFQSGAVGYFHDRTINLDGKVNPEALYARKSNRLSQYMIDINAKYMADWYDRKYWMNDSAISKNYEMIVCDSLKDLVVLKKKDR